jgi:hypothetical protein
MDWQFYYDSVTDKVYFEPKGFTANTNVLVVGTDVGKVPKWEEDSSEMANNITISGAYQESFKTELFNGDGGMTSFTLDKVPIATDVYVGAAQKVGSVDGGYSSSYDYYVDKVRKQIVFTTPPGVGVNNVQVDYTYATPLPVRGSNDLSIADYGEYKRTFIFTDLRRADDAEARLNNLLEKFSQPFVRATLRVLSPDTLNVKAGQMIRVVDEVNNVDRTVLINRHISNWPAAMDELQVGDREFRVAEWGAMVNERLKRLEEEQIENQDMLLHLVSLGVNLTVGRESLNVFRRNVNDSFVFDHNCNGLLDWNSQYNQSTNLYDGTFTNSKQSVAGVIELVSTASAGTWVSECLNKRGTWGTLTFAKTTGGSSTLTVDVLSSSGTVLASNVTSPYDASALTQSQLKIRANLTPAAGVGSSLDSWSLTTDTATAYRYDDQGDAWGSAVYSVTY